MNGKMLRCIKPSLFMELPLSVIQVDSRPCPRRQGWFLGREHRGPTVCLLWDRAFRIQWQGKRSSVYYDPFLKDRETDGQRGDVACPRSRG